MRRSGFVDQTGYAKRATAGFLAVALAFLSVMWELKVAAVTPYTPAQARLEAGLGACEEQIAFLDLAITPTALRQLYTTVLEDRPEFFYVAPRLTYSYREGETGTVAETVYPTYTITGAALVEARIFYRNTVMDMIAEMDAVFEGHPHTEAETVLYLHDALAARYEYDTRPPGETVTTAYGLFREGRGVCQAYAMALLALLRAAGLEADLVTSPQMDHAWVHVRADGVWYHVDVTRDDPIPTEADRAAGRSYVTHTRLLRSDAGLLSLGYRGFSCTAVHAGAQAGSHAAADARYETPTGETVFGQFETKLLPLSVGDGRQLVWVGTNADGAPQSMSFTKTGACLHAPGDMDGDGTVTPGDLLLLDHSSLPPSWREWVKTRLVAPKSS